MHYEGTVIRPPSEAGSIILQITVGCPHNRCSFCGTYKEVAFRIRDHADIEEDLDFISRYCHRQTSVFLADGDVLALSQKRLINLLTRIRAKADWIKRIRLYARAPSVLAKSAEELRELKDLGLDRIYMGLESGSDRILTAVRKGADSRQMVQAAKRVREEAGLFLSTTVLLGLGGIEGSREHAVETGKILSRMEPNQIAVLTLMLLPNTELYQLEKAGKFSTPSANELLPELQLLLENIRVGKNCQFQTNHASNYLPIKGRLPRDREKIIREIKAGIAGHLPLRSEQIRGL